VTINNKKGISNQSVKFEPTMKTKFN